MPEKNFELGLTDSWPVERPEKWEHWITESLFDDELTHRRDCVNHHTPFDVPEWQRHVATTFGLESTLRARGRPRTHSEQ